MKDSIFTQIIKGEVPAHKVYEDERTLAFMDIFPIQPGAVLVVSKMQIDHVYDLPPDEYTALFMTVRKVGAAMRKAFPDIPRVGIIVEGFEVPHVHVKVIPVDSGNALRNIPDTSVQADHAKLAEQARSIAALMSE